MGAARVDDQVEGSLLEEVVDGRSGRIRAQGHLTVQGAGLLCGTVQGVDVLVRDVPRPRDPAD